jgi:mannose-6-phosphate isomerase class I
MLWHRDMVSRSIQQPLVIGGVHTPKAWGSETWLSASQAIAGQPELLGEWTRLLFGDEVPIFGKLLRTNFSPLVHVGFRRAVTRNELMLWIAREQASLRELLAALDLGDRGRFDAFATLYADWATIQGRMRWQSADELAFAERLRPFTATENREQLVMRLGQLRRNRAEIVDALNEVDLRREQGNLLLTSAGLVHAIFGLSHQTHPLDHSRAVLENLLAKMRRLARAGRSDDEIRAIVDGDALAEARARNVAPPKNEAWLPIGVGGKLALVEPQQTSDTTYSFADFYTPFVWAGERARFRKGDPAFGLRSAEVARQLETVDLSATSLDAIRCKPELIAESNLTRLIDAPERWPFFTAHRLELDRSANWRGDHAPGVFQQLVVVQGDVELSTNGGSVRLGPEASAFIPATMRGGYRLTSDGGATVLAFAVPGPRGGISHG